VREGDTVRVSKSKRERERESKRVGEIELEMGCQNVTAGAFVFT